MKSLKITYWVSTILISAMMLMSSVSYFISSQIAQAFTHIGFPGYFRVELAIAKFLGAAALLAPVSPRIKEWAYFGFFVMFVSALIAHVASGDPASVVAAPGIAIVMLSVSYITFHRSLNYLKQTAQ